LLGGPPAFWTAALAPDVARKLAPCGVAIPDARDEVFIAAWRLLGVDPANLRERDVKAAADLILRARAAVRLPVSRDPISAIAGGEVCLTFGDAAQAEIASRDRKSTRLNSSHRCISYAVSCLKKKNSKNMIGRNVNDLWHRNRDYAQEGDW